MKLVNTVPAALILSTAMIICTLLIRSTPAAVTTADVIPEPDPAPPEISTVPELDARSQYTLVEASLKARADADLADSKLAAVRKDWVKHRVRWQMRYIAPLCQRADSCAVAPVDYNQFEGRVVQGWLPSLELTETSHAQVVSQCEGKARCVIEFEAEIKELVLSTVEPTSMTLSHIEILSARSASDSESWVKRKRQVLPKS